MNSTSGLDKSGSFSRVDPNDVDTVFVCALGSTINNDIEVFNRELREDILGSLGIIASDEGRHSQ